MTTHLEPRTIDEVWDGTDAIMNVTFDEDDPIDTFSVLMSSDGTFTGVVTDNGVLYLTVNSICFVECDGDCYDG